MPYFLLAALLLLIAALLWRSQAVSPTVPPLAQPSPPVISPGLLDALCAAAASLQELMAHPLLGGPGFLSLRFPPEGGATVTAQYPNIREALYRRVVRRELSPEHLLAEGFPASLLTLSPEFETESGGIILLTVTVPLDPGLAQSITNLRQRQAVLHDLSDHLRNRFPELSVRCAGGELLLSPVRAPDGS
jgi:hypothetical protein